jgi:hypothetical protein
VDDPFVAALWLATDLRPVLLTNIVVNFNREAAALATFAPVKPVRSRSLDVESFACLSVGVPRLAFAPQFSSVVVERPAAL